MTQMIYILEDSFLYKCLGFPQKPKPIKKRSDIKIQFSP